MDPWEQKLKDSGISQAVSLVEEALNGYSEAELSIEDRGYLNKIRAVNEQVSSIVENTDPKIINYSSIPAVVSNLNNVSSYLGSWDGGASPNYLSVYAINEIDAALQQVPLLSPAVSISEARSAITNLRRSAARQRTIVDDITRKIEEKGSLADKTIEEKLSEFTETIDKQVNTTIDKLNGVGEEADEVDTRLAEVKAAANKLATDQNEVFNTAQTTRAKAFEDFLKARENETGGLLTSIAQKSGTELDAIKKRAESSASLTDAARIKSQELLGIVSDNALINDYSKNGRLERRWALIWRIITMLSLLAAVITGGILALSTDQDTSWQKLVARLAILIATGGLAAYAASQAAEHTRAQRQAEHMALQLSAVRPYLADVEDKTERDKLLIKLAEKFFNEKKTRDTKPALGKKSQSDNVISADDLPGLIAAIVGIMNTTKK